MRLFSSIEKIPTIGADKLGPNIDWLVTDIQVNVYIDGNTLSRLSFQNWLILKFKNHISIISLLFLYISVIFLQKAMVQYTLFKTALLYLLKVSVFMNIDKKPRYHFKLFLAFFSQKIVKNRPKKVRKLQFYFQQLVIFQLHILGVTSYNLGYVQNQFYWL